MSLVQSVVDGVAEKTSLLKNSENKNDLGKDAFLKLLVTQMQYQDPLNPQNDTQFVAQLAQFSSLEQLQNLNSTYSRSSALNLVGSSVIMKTQDEKGGESYVTGTVQYVTMIAGKAYLAINDSMYSIDDLDSVISDAYLMQKFNDEENEEIVEMAKKALGPNITIPYSEEGYASEADKAKATAMMIQATLESTKGKSPDYSGITVAVKWDTEESRYVMTLSKGKASQTVDITISMAENYVQTAKVTLGTEFTVPYTEEGYEDESNIAGVATLRIQSILDETKGKTPDLSGVVALITWDSENSKYVMRLAQGDIMESIDVTIEVADKLPDEENNTEEDLSDSNSDDDGGTEPSEE